MHVGIASAPRGPAMAAAADESLRRAIGALVTALSELGVPFMIIGGIAVILRGVARQTNDVDATVWAEGLDVERVLTTLGRHGIGGRIADVADFARAHQVFLLRHADTATPMELSLAWLPFEQTALRRAETLDVEGLRVPVAAVDDLIVYKSVAWRDRDRADIERLLQLHADRIDLTYVRGAVAEFARVLHEPERLREFERLIERAGNG